MLRLKNKRKKKDLRSILLLCILKNNYFSLLNKTYSREIINKTLTKKKKNTTNKVCKQK